MAHSADTYAAQLDVSREVLDWAMEDHAFGVIDVNFLSHISTVKGGVSLPATFSSTGDREHGRMLIPPPIRPVFRSTRSRIARSSDDWRCTSGTTSSGKCSIRSDLTVLACTDGDALIDSLCAAQHVILFGTGVGCHALMDIVRNRCKLLSLFCVLPTHSDDD